MPKEFEFYYLNNKEPSKAYEQGQTSSCSSFWNVNGSSMEVGRGQEDSFVQGGGPVTNPGTGISLCACAKASPGAGWGSTGCVCQRSNRETNSVFHTENILIPMTL